MAMRNCGTPLRGSGKDQTVWKLEFTATGATGEVSLDSTQSDRDPDIATPVADSGSTGITSITFPKCSRAWVLHCSIEEPTVGTSAQMAKVSDMSPTTGVCSFAVYSDAFALAHATNGSRGRLTLLLERS